MLKNAAFALALLTALNLFQASAQESEIVARVSGQVPVSVRPFEGGGGAEATQVASQDLRIQGCRIVSSGGRYVVQGTVTGGSSLQGTLADAAGKTLLSQTYSAGSLRQAVHQFTDDVIEKIFGMKGIGTSKIAFVSTRSGKKEIYLADYDGHNARAITGDNSINVGPNLSRDGSMVVYTSYSKGFPDLVLQRFATRDRKRIAAFPGTNTGGAISPDNRQVALSASVYGNPEIVVIPLLGGQPRRLTSTRGTDSSPSWSPDGSRLVYVSDDRGSAQLHVIPAGGGASQRLPTQSSYSTEPNWSPTGKEIAFTTRQGGVFQISILDLDTNKVRTVTNEGENTDPVWSPNGRQLLFSRHSGGRSSLIVLDVGSGETLQLSRNLGDCTEPSWSR